MEREKLRHYDSGSHSRSATDYYSHLRKVREMERG